MTGLVLGKFLPPHHGHHYLVDFGLAYCADLTVLVCSLEGEPIPGALRHQWMAARHPRARVLHVEDDNPQSPEEHAQFWEIWRRTVLTRMAAPDLVFASESYGSRLAAELGARFVPVDPGRALVPISGTAVRQDPAAHARFLTDPVRRHYGVSPAPGRSRPPTRVCVMGPESTGKTTLARALADHFQTRWVAEYARGLIEHESAGAADPLAALTLGTIERIARGQLASEAALAAQADGYLFSDTDLLTTTLWSDLFFEGCPAWVTEAARQQSFELTLLMDTDLPWAPDPQRAHPEGRRAFFERCRAALDAAGRRVAVVRGLGSDRLNAAIDLVVELHHSSSDT